MYKEKLARLNAQIDALQAGTHPEYVKRIKKLESQYKERLRLNEVHREYLFECLERDYTLEKNAADKEYDDKKIDLRENLLTDYEDKRKMIENERNTMELNSDSTEIKPTVTRKLRRRPNEPIPLTTNEKRRKPNSGQLIYQLDEKDIDMDLKFISRPITPTNYYQQNGFGSSNGNFFGNNSPYHNNHHISLMYPDSSEMMSPTHSISGSYNSPNSNSGNNVETRIEDGKLLYERRWFHRGQPVFVEGKDISKFAANISAIGNEVVWVKKVNDSNKVKINMNHLAKGKIVIKRRAN
ncbi:SUDS3 family protein [Megaselia abdita]